MPPFEEEQRKTQKNIEIKKEQKQPEAELKKSQYPFIEGVEKADDKLILRSVLAGKIYQAARRSINVKRIDAASQMKMETRYRSRGPLKKPAEYTVPVYATGEELVSKKEENGN